MTKRSFRLAVLFLCCLQSRGWNAQPKPAKPRQWRKQVVNFAAAAIITVFAPIGNQHIPWNTPPAMAIEAPFSMDENLLRQSLKPPTEDRPQIMLPAGNTEVPADKQPIVEGKIIWRMITSSGTESAST